MTVVDDEGAVKYSLTTENEPYSKTGEKTIKSGESYNENAISYTEVAKQNFGAGVEKIENVKCYNQNCGKICSGDALIYQVRVVHSDGQELYVPCCSEECAYLVQRHYMSIHQARYNSVKTQLFQKISVKNYTLYFD